MMTPDMLTHVEVAAGFERKLDALPMVLRVLGKLPEVPARKAVWLASATTAGRIGLGVSVFNLVAAMFGFMRERIRGLAGRPADWPAIHTTSVPPAL
jgi:hypothetical protein